MNCGGLFTGKERDVETGLDYFGARYLSGAMGRFTSPDAPLVDQHVGDPQSWNLYSYVRNNPLRYTDPTGRPCLGALFGNHSAESCADELIGGAKAVANVVPGAATLINRTINTVAGTNLPDAPMLNPRNPDQADGMNAANFVMLVPLLAEAAAGKLVELGQTARTAEVVIASAKSPQATAHISEAQAAGHPSVLTPDRSLARPNRKVALAETPAPPKGSAFSGRIPTCVLPRRWNLRQCSSHFRPRP